MDKAMVDSKVRQIQFKKSVNEQVVASIPQFWDYAGTSFSLSFPIISFYHK